MKKNYFAAIILFMAGLVYGQSPFITTWQVSGDLSITVPVVGNSNNFTVDFGDGTILTGQTAAVSHNYAASGTYTVTLSGDFDQIRFSDYSQQNAAKLKTVSQWGDTQWASMEKAFYYCAKLTITASDEPDLSQVTDMSNMFFYCESLNQPLNNWDVSHVSTMERMFYYAKAFNKPLNNWDVSSVTNMDSMFYSATSFNQPLNNWDVSAVTTMYRMFYNAKLFNQPLSNWDVSHVSIMYRMFYKAFAFNQPLDQWDYTNIHNLVGFLDFTSLSVDNYDALLEHFLQLGLENKELGAEGLEYCSYLVRDQLIDNFGWQITGDSQGPDCTDISSFVTTWRADGNNSIAVPIVGSNNNYTIDFGDGTVLTNQTGPVSHIYSAPGVYTVTISGEIHQIRFQNIEAGAVKLLTVQQWGTTQWTSMQAAFRGCTNLTITATDIPDLSLVTDTGLMFTDCSSLNQSLNGWDVSHVQNMESMFSGTTLFNQPLSNWDVSGVVNMNSMFAGAHSFNQDINSWDVSHVNSTAAMFQGATAFNQPLNNWDVSGVVNMSGMFMGASAFNQPIGNWDISNVSDMESMFYYATSFNQPLSNWDFSGVTTTPAFLYFIRYSGLNSTNYDILLQRFLESGLTGKQLVAYDLQYCSSAIRYSLINDRGWAVYGDTQSTSCPSVPFITTWTVPSNSKFITVPVVGTGNNYTINFGDGTTLTGQTGAVTHSYAVAGTYTVTMSGDFHRLQFQPGNINSTKIRTIQQWGNTQWTSMYYAFGGCTNLQIPATDAPDLSLVTDMSGMVGGCSSFNQDISHWDVSHVTNMSRLFSSCSIFNQNIDNWDVSHVTDMSYMFASTLAFNQPIDSWDVSQVTNMRYMFYNARVFNQTLNSWDTSNVTDMIWMFAGAYAFNKAIGNWDVSSVTDMTSMFDQARKFNQPIGNWDISNLTGLYRTFAGCKAFNQDINNWDVSNVTSLYMTFVECTVFNKPLNNWNVGNVTDMYATFLSCPSFNQPLSNWDVSNVTSMISTFEGASSFNQNINSWDVSSVTVMQQTFRLATAFNQPLNNWDVSSVQTMGGLFSSATHFNQPLDNWDVSASFDVSNMFMDATAFNQPLDSWNFNASTSYSNFLNNTALSVANYDALLNKFVLQGYHNKQLGALGRQYCDVTARAALIANGWTITGDSHSTTCTSPRQPLPGKDTVADAADATDANILLYPNPADNIVKLSVTGDIKPEAITIYDLQGKQLLNFEQNVDEVNIQALSAGVYLVHVKTNKGLIEYRLVKN